MPRGDPLCNTNPSRGSNLNGCSDLGIFEGNEILARKGRDQEELISSTGSVFGNSRLVLVLVFKDVFKYRE